MDKGDLDVRNFGFYTANHVPSTELVDRLKTDEVGNLWKWSKSCLYR